MELAHEKSGHMGAKKVRAMLNKRFTWSGIGSDVVNHVKSCVHCGRINKAGNLLVVLQERPIVSEPFRSVAIDIVGPLPKAKSGV